jgi:DNA replication initiation complex subunit (GINS family)
MPKLPENFYPELRRFLAEFKTEIAKAPEKMREYEKIGHLTQDIVNARLKKIVSLASTPTRTEQVLKNFTGEERFLYEQLYTLIHEWRKQILEFEGAEQ